MKILIPTDGSELSLIAIDKALEIAKKSDEIHIITVLPSTFGFSMDIPEAFHQKILLEMEMNANQMIDKIIQSIESSKKLELTIKKEVLVALSITDSIIDYADKEDIDLIIMGSHGANKTGFILGSIASKVVQNAKCSVYVVKKP